MGCGEFRPLLRTGEYVVKGFSLNVRSSPGIKSGVQFSLPRGTRVELTEDTGPPDKHDDEIAPWVKIRTKDGRTGFAFGGYLEYTKFWMLTAAEVCNLKGPLGW